MAVATLNNPSSIGVADVDGDGDHDILATSQLDNTVTWHENTGGGTFAVVPITISDNALGASSVTAADLDYDGDIDVIATSGGDNTVAWFENQGGGVFINATSITTAGTNPRSAIAVDLDMDGDLDVASGSADDDSIWWIENLGGGVFAASSQRVTMSADGINCVLAVDLDRDGDPDLVSASPGDNKVAWYRNNTIHRSAAYPEMALVSFESIGAAWLQPVDMDDDGDSDVLVASHGDSKVAWYENSGGGTFVSAPNVIYSLAVGAISVYGADLDSDGDADVLSASGDDHTVGWYRNLGAGVFDGERIVITDTANGAVAVKTADFDNDGDDDVVFAAYHGDVIGWFANDGSGLFGPEQLVAAMNSPSSIEVADLDGDGDTDVIATSFHDDQVAWYQNTGGSFDGVAHVLTDTAMVAMSVTAADLDSDGLLDVIAASGDDDTVAWFENQGEGEFSGARVISSAGDFPRTVAAADLDNDGDLDVVVGSADDDTVAWFENSGGGGFSGARNVITTSADNVSSVNVADLDLDGNLDVLSASPWEDRIAWFANQGGQFALDTQSTAPAGLVEGSTDDLLRIVANHRGRPGDTDIVLATITLLFESSPGVPLTTVEANLMTEALSLYLDDGSETFEYTDELVTTIDTLALSDGIQDLVIADGETAARFVVGQPKTFFIVISLTPDAASHVPSTLQVTHITQGTRITSAEDFIADIAMDLEDTCNVSSGLIFLTTSEIFSDGFETGNTSAWLYTVED